VQTNARGLECGREPAEKGVELVQGDLARITVPSLVGSDRKGQYIRV